MDYARFDNVEPGDRLIRRNATYKVLHKITYPRGGGYLELLGDEGPTVWSSVEFNRRRFLKEVDS